MAENKLRKGIVAKKYAVTGADAWNPEAMEANASRRQTGGLRSAPEAALYRHFPSKTSGMFDSLIEFIEDSPDYPYQSDLKR